MVMTPEELKRKVFPGESGGDYNALYGYSNRPGGAFSGVNLTNMTVNDALAFSAANGPYGQWSKAKLGYRATPMGAYQVVGTTLGAAMKGLGLTGNEKMTPELQDAIGMWIYQNQGPGAWEAWGKGGGGGGVVTASSKGGQPMGLLAMQDDEPQTFGQRLKKSWQSGELLENLALGFNSMTLRPDPNMGQMIGQRQERRAAKETANRTAAWLEAQGRPDLAEAVRGGIIGGGDAFNVMNAKDEKTALMQNFEFAKAQGYTGTFTDFMAAQGNGTTVNIGEPMKIMSDGRIAVKDPSVDGGVRFITPPGSQAEADAAAAASKTGQKAENEQTFGTAAVGAIDKLIGEDGTGGMLSSNKGVLDLPEAGIWGSRLADMGLNQEAVNVKNTLKTVTANIAFGRLQAMRDASATGGALGSVTENELGMLMNSLGAVEQSTDPALLRENLIVIRDIWKKINSDPVARQFYYGGGGAAAAPATPQATDDGITTLGSW
jgi:hypothetical protein